MSPVDDSIANRYTHRNFTNIGNAVYGAPVRHFRAISTALGRLKVLLWQGSRAASLVRKDSRGHNRNCIP